MKPEKNWEKVDENCKIPENNRKTTENRRNQGENMNKIEKNNEKAGNACNLGKPFLHENINNWREIFFSRETKKNSRKSKKKCNGRKKL